MSDTKQQELTITKAKTVKPKADPRTKPKLLPPYVVILYNDPDHSIVYVIDVLRRVCGHSWFKAMRLTMQAHTTGRAAVWSGAFEHAEFKRGRIRGFGPDIYASRSVNYPLKCEIEPLPQ